ncbi:MAG: nickel/cobalt transporter (NiCoT) family protein [Pseudonocardiales bacterium]|jgi:nickel/cobalt transporter (NiCoT) family protein|nr:nickel/cobalt transporter (NiCoT) family protein [Pseudonocardiales bacterium]
MLEACPSSRNLRPWIAPAKCCSKLSHSFAKPVRKVFYNITITALSVAVALIIGTIELVGVFDDQAGINSGLLAAIGSIPLDYAGYGIVALFVLAWLIALAVWRFGRIEEKWSAKLAPSPSTVE